MHECGPFRTYMNTRSQEEAQFGCQNDMVVIIEETFIMLLVWIHGITLLAESAVNWYAWKKNKENGTLVFGGNEPPELFSGCGHGRVEL